MPIFTSQIQVYADKIGEFRFRFLCGRGEARLRASEGYNAKANAIKGINSLLKNVHDDKRVDFKVNARGKHFFTVKARNGNILAISRNHEELDAVEEEIAVIRSEIADAEIVEVLDR